MKKTLLILVAVLSTAFVASAQKKSNSIDWESMYRREVNIGFAVTGKVFNTYYHVPGTGGYWGPDVGSVYATRGGDVSNGSVSTNFSRPFIETIHGLQFNDYFFAGVGVGLQYYCGKLHDFQSYAAIAAQFKGKSKTPNRWNALGMPIFLDFRGMYPLSEDLIPFINLGLGSTPIFCSSINAKYSQDEYGVKVRYNQRLRGGFYCDFGGGIRWKDYNVSIGLQHQNLKVASITKHEGEKMEEQLKMKTNAFYVKLGYSF